MNFKAGDKVKYTRRGGHYVNGKVYEVLERFGYDSYTMTIENAWVMYEKDMKLVSRPLCKMNMKKHEF
jgi:hypothetical protein